MVRTRSQWRASPSRLSPELLCMIFAWFCPHCRDTEWPHWVGCDEVDQRREQDVRSLASLCRVSLSFRNAAQGIMYHCFEPRYPTSCRPRASWPWRPRLDLFLRTIAARPDLARSVKAVSLDPASTACLDFFASRDAFEHCAHSLGINPVDLWEQRAQHYHGNPQDHNQGVMAFFVRDADPGSWAQRPFLPFLASELLTMLVALLPNLRYLKIDSAIEEFDLSRETINSLGLTRLSLKKFDAKFPFESILALAPNIETLVSRERSGQPWRNLPSVHSLMIAAQSMNRFEIQNAVSACTSYLSNFAYRGTNVTSAEIIQVLDTEKLHTTLESIHIDVRIPINPFRSQNRMPMPSLHAFMNLQMLFLTTSSIYVDTASVRSDKQAIVSILPPSVRSLTLVDNEKVVSPERLRSGMLGLAKGKNPLFKNLELVRCNTVQACDRYVKRMFQHVGVDCRYQEFPRPDCNDDQELSLLNSLRFEDEIGYAGHFPLPDEFSDDDL